ncbi:YggS family pyridoxal phosphate-dependent enzyme [Phytoactinopolyspora mesophila]|uniref:Pyridoxal phosphate homeostasis protein n=1 Tax=Phytoactinopolyspora mesophila TaxID=2650750 RepID=A0A7K3M3A9_9ACTN|nr:YggS family pyridoxal phosphate-dependent enzyme [Phytoactinopolyspora mesophila]NDL57804.1 YggS family pyridoxal phosphate-dependent enzyme [Phytoactinopolyspora mesophila]
MLTDAQIHANVSALRERIDAACREAGRDAADVDLLLATKQVPADRIRVAIDAGARLIGENKVQELADKDAQLAGTECERHFIGHLQSNKVNHVLRYVTCIQSVDSIGLADRLQRRLDALDQNVDVLVQVNTSGEASKYGVPPEEASALVKEIAKRDRLRVRGLMTIGLPAATPDLIRPSYQSLRVVRDRIRDETGGSVSAGVLSMGMSRDLDIAIAEGSTMVRVGTAVFGARSY